MTVGKLHKLLAKLDALAQRPGTPAEGAAAKRKADALRQRYADLLAAAPLAAPAEPEPQPTNHWYGYGVTFGTSVNVVINEWTVTVP